MDRYRSNLYGFGNHPAPKASPGLICFIVAFAIAGLISQKYVLEIGIPLTYLLIKLNQYLRARILNKKKEEGR